jgi:chorismate mutase
MTDDVVRTLREEITAADREIFAAVNRRVDLVARLKRHKEEHGIGFVDPDRERQMAEERLQENAGPLSEHGLRSFYAELLALTKREVG